MDNFVETREICVKGEYDVIVVGAGVAGIGAALAAKRQGSSVLVIEKGIYMGGLATMGHVCLYLGLCDGYGRKAIGGIAEELLHLSIKYGYNTLPEGWTMGISKNPIPSCKRYETMFNVPAFVLALDELFEAEQIDILYDTVFCAPVIDDGRCTAIIVENKSGRMAYKCKAVVDASGDADVLFRAGAKCVEQKNMITYLCYDSTLEEMRRAVENGNIYQAVHWRELGCLPSTPKEIVNQFGWYSASSGEDVSKGVKLSRKFALDYLKKHLGPNYTMLSVPAMPLWRKTRRLEGVYTLHPEDDHRYFEDSIGCTGDWRKAGPVFEIPYRALITPDLKNVFASGRNIASADDAWEVTRVIPPAAMTGEAAGTAAAILVQSGCDAQEISVPELQNALEKSGVLIHWHHEQPSDER